MGGEQRVELEQATRQRLANQVSRLKEEKDRLEGDGDQLRSKAQTEQEKQRKVLNQFRDLKEDYISLQGKEMDVSEKKNILEKKLEIAESENVVVRTELDMALRRIEDFQVAINSELDISDCGTVIMSSDGSGSEEDLDSFLENHRKAISWQKEREGKIRESIARELSETGQVRETSEGRHSRQSGQSSPGQKEGCRVFSF